VRLNLSCETECSLVFCPSIAVHNFDFRFIKTKHLTNGDEGKTREICIFERTYVFSTSFKHNFDFRFIIN